MNDVEDGHQAVVASKASGKNGPLQKQAASEGARPQSVGFSITSGLGLTAEPRRFRRSFRGEPFEHPWRAAGRS